MFLTRSIRGAGLAGTVLLFGLFHGAVQAQSAADNIRPVGQVCLAGQACVGTTAGNGSTAAAPVVAAAPEPVAAARDPEPVEEEPAEDASAPHSRKRHRGH